MHSVTCMQLGLRRRPGLLRCWKSSVSLGKSQLLGLLFGLLGELIAWSIPILLGLLRSSPAHTTQSECHDFLTPRRLSWTQGHFRTCSQTGKPKLLILSYSPHTICIHGGESAKCLTLWVLEVPLKLKLTALSILLASVSLSICLWLLNVDVQLLFGMCKPFFV